MSWYHFAILIHVIGVLLLASALVLVNVVWSISRNIATISQLQVISSLIQLAPKLFGISTVLILISGIWLTVLNIQHDDPYSWIIVSFIGFVAMGIAGSSKSKRVSRLMIKEAKKDKGDLSPKVKKALNSDGLRGSAATSTTLFLGVLVLMIFQPSFLASILVLLVATLVSYYSQKAFFSQKSVSTKPSQS